MTELFDVIVVGAGPAGSSAATMMARQGLKTLLLDQATFPRDKVCGDGITPQAIPLLELLGCAPEVRRAAGPGVDRGDIFINGRYGLTGRFPKLGRKRGRTLLLERSKLDNILMQNAVANGVLFTDGCAVRGVARERGGWLTVRTRQPASTVLYRSRMVVGADGANSVVSRSLGNPARNGLRAIGIRQYYNGASAGPSVRLYFDERFFPGYGWVFVNGNGRANIGIGYLCDDTFRLRPNMLGLFKAFTESLGPILKKAKPEGKARGGWVFLSPRERIVGPGIVLIGDAGNMINPINGAGIYRAMESGMLAARTIHEAFDNGDFSEEFLKRFEKEWNRRTESDRRAAQFVLSIVKNPAFNNVCLTLLEWVAATMRNDSRFEALCGEIFCGDGSAANPMLPFSLLQSIVLNQGTLSTLLRGRGSQDAFPDIMGLPGLLIQAADRVVAHPITSALWGAEVALHGLGLLTSEVLAGVTAITGSSGKTAVRDARGITIQKAQEN
jgi:geranylgeranyl reductase family protein